MMPWWVWLWLLLMLVLSVSGSYADLLQKKPLWYAICGLMTGLICLFAVVAYFGLFQWPGPPYLLLLLTVLAGIWLIYDGVIDLRELSEADGDLSFIDVGRIALADLLFMPAIALGVTDAIKLLRSAD